MKTVRTVLEYTLFGACLLLTCACVLGMWWLKDYTPFSADTTDRAIIEGNAEIKLPPSTSHLYGHTEGLNHIFTRASFAMDASDLVSFLRGTHCSESLSRVDPKKYEAASSSAPWWNPAHAQDLYACWGGTEDFHQTILVDMTDPQTYMVYVIASTD